MNGWTRIVLLHRTPKHHKAVWFLRHLQGKIRSRLIIMKPGKRQRKVRRIRLCKNQKMYTHRQRPMGPITSPVHRSRVKMRRVVQAVWHTTILIQAETHQYLAILRFIVLFARQALAKPVIKVILAGLRKRAIGFVTQELWRFALYFVWGRALVVV